MKTVAHITIAFLLLAPLAAQTTTPNLPYPLLFCGTDESGFGGMNGQLAVIRTNGATPIGSVMTFDLSFPLNGLTKAGGFLLSGQPEDVNGVAGNTLRKLTLTTPPTLISTILPGVNSFSNTCCNEQMVEAPGGGFYHAHYSDVIQLVSIDSSGQSQVVQTYTQSDVVGMASDGTKIWISKWGDRQVGTWDPATNTFTLVFSTPNDAGALAWDVANGVLWVGMAGGSVIPYNAAGQQLGNGFQPFGSISATVDGLAFISK